MAPPTSTRDRQGGFTLLEVLVTLGIVGVLSAIGMPMIGNAMASLRLSGDTRSISNSIAVAKLRAASVFSRVRLFIDLSDGSHHIELWDKTTNKWQAEGGTTYLSTDTSYDFGSVGTPPPNTQVTMGQAPACTNDAGASIANTSCIVFNSRGLTVDSAGSPTALDAVYLTNGMEVHAITVSATGMGRVWRTQPTSTPQWILQ